MDVGLSKLGEIVKDRVAWSAADHGIANRHNLVSEQQQTREHPHDGVLCSYEKDATELDTLMHKEETFPKECM